MVATYSSPKHRAWRPTSRTLGAAFAGSAVMFVAAAVQGGSVLPAPDQADPVSGTATSDAGRAVPTGQAPAGGRAASSGPVASAGTAGITPSPTLATAVAPPPRQAAEWTPGAAPTWETPLSQLPVRRAPVQGMSAVDHSSAGSSYVNTNTSSEATGATTTGETGQSGGTDSAPRSADRPHGADLVGGVLGGVGNLTGALGF